MATLGALLGRTRGFPEDLQPRPDAATLAEALHLRGELWTFELDDHIHFMVFVFFDYKLLLVILVVFFPVLPILVASIFVLSLSLSLLTVPVSFPLFFVL